MFWLLFGLSLGFQALIYGVITSKPVIRSDGVGYYLYLPAAFVHHDLALETMEQREFPGGLPVSTGAVRVDGHYLIKYPLGEALLQAPFFLVAHGVAKVLGQTSVFAWPYQCAAAVAGAFYFAWGGCWLWRLLRGTFSPRVSALALGFTIFGTNLLHYATYDAGFSHAYSFFLFAALLVLSRRLPTASAATWLGAGLLTGLIVVTRPTNMLFLLFVLADWTTDAGSWQVALSRFREKLREFGVALVGAIVPVGLQMAYWKSVSGHWVVYAYGEEGFNFAHPALGRVLFSVEKGWFVYVPLAALALVGWIVARRMLARWFPAFLVFTALNLWVIASWHDWGYGGSFATRPLVESSPLLALGLAGAFWRAENSPSANRVVLGVASVCTTYTFLLMLGYWLKTLPFSQATGADIVNSLTLQWLFDLAK